MAKGGRARTPVTPQIKTGDDSCHTSGKYCCNASTDHHQKSEPAEYHGKRCPTLDFSDASNTDGSERQGPNGEDVERCQEAGECRMVGTIDEISRIRSHGI